VATAGRRAPAAGGPYVPRRQRDAGNDAAADGLARAAARARSAVGVGADAPAPYAAD